MFVKSNVSEDDYQYVLREVEQEVPLEQLRRILNKGGKNSRVIFKLK
jgi:hypothetical protein